MSNIPQKFIYREVPEKQLMKLVRALKRNGKLKVNGLGIFYVKKRKASKMVDNINKKVVHVASRKTVAFKPSDTIKKYINNVK